MGTKNKYPMYWKNNIEKIREKVKTLSQIPGNFLDYESCNFIQSCLLDYANACQELQETKTKKHGIAIRERKTNELVEFIECDTGRDALRVLSGIRINMGSDFEASETFIEEDEIKKLN